MRSPRESRRREPISCGRYLKEMADQAGDGLLGPKGRLGAESAPQKKPAARSGLWSSSRA